MDNITVINLSKYTSPLISEVHNREWIEYGADNNYFQYLIDRFTGSTTNNAIINGVSRMIYGRGISALDSNRKPDAYAQMISLFSKEDLRRFIIDRKMLGMAAFQVSYDKGKVAKVAHFPMKDLRAEKANKDGEIEAWYYHPDWDDLRAGEDPLRINSFGFGNKKGNEVFVLQPYVAGYYYYSPVDYVGALPYCVLEEEISDFLINDTINGFSGSKVINFNNGVPDKKKREEVKRDVLRKLTGATGEKVIVAFNDNAENATTVEDLPLDNAPEHYQYLSDECRNKLIVGHSVTNPILIGIKETGGGLSNNADELKVSSLFFHNTTIRPFQDEIIDVMDAILAVNDISLKLYFKTIQPLEFIDTDGMDADTEEEETGVKMCSHKFSTDKDDEIAKMLIDLGEDENLDEWKLIDERDVNYDDEQYLDQELDELNAVNKESILSKIWDFVSTGSPRAGAKSKQDKKVKDIYFMVRYFYHPKKVSENSRAFCKAMVNAGKLYRKEDIIKMNSQAVNAGWGTKPDTSKYDIFKYKGGGDCHHRWRRKTYASLTKTNPRGVAAKPIGTRAAEIAGYKITNDWEVSVRPTDMPNGGFVKPNRGKG